MSVVKIDGAEYAMDSLSDAAKAQIANIQAVERRIQDLREQMVMLQAAKITFVGALKSQLGAAEQINAAEVPAAEPSAAEGEPAAMTID